MNASDRAIELNSESVEIFGAGGMLLTIAQEHWLEIGVSTGDDLDAYLAFCEFVDAYKDVNGIKPRWMAWQDRSAGDWHALSDGLADEQAESARLADADLTDWLAERTPAALAEARLDELQERLSGWRGSRASCI